MSDKYNKEEPSLLQKIQNQTGCLFLIIGIAMLAFVLTDLVSSGTSIFGSNENNVGSIGDEPVTYEEFNGTYESLKFQVTQNNPGFVFDESMASQYREQAWSIIIEDKTLKPEYDKVGITVSAAELEDLTIGDNTHPQIQQSFRNPENNQFDKNRLIRFLKDDINNDPQAMQSWTSFQTQFTSNLIGQKYSSIVASSFYTTDLEASTKSREEGQSVNATIVAVPYAQETDETITVTDSEILAYAKKHRSQFEKDASRSIEYVRLNVVPSKQDSVEMMNWAAGIAQDFASSKDDSAFVSLKGSESPFDPTFRGRGTFSPEIEEVLFTAEEGAVVGPFQKNGVYSVFKVTGTGVDTAGEKTIQVALVDQSIFASTATDSRHYSRAGEVLTKVTGDATFEEVVEKLGLSKRVASNITEKNRQIPGIPNADKIARWLFDSETEEGDISNIIDLNGGYLVARVSKVTEEGLPSADDLRDEVELSVRNEKIAATLAPKVETALASASSAEELAIAIKSTPVPIPAMNFNRTNLPGVGDDPSIAGAIFGTKVGGHSHVISGNTAVAVVYVNNENQYTPADITLVKAQMKQQLIQSIQNSVRIALEDKSNVKDLRYKFYDN